MNKTILLLLAWVLIGMASQDYYQNQILFCMNSNTAPLEILHNGKQLASGNKQLDQLLTRYKIISLKKWLPMADERDVVDGIELQNIYVAKFQSTKSYSELNGIVNDFRNAQDIHSAELHALHRLDISQDSFVPNDPYYDRQWYLPVIGADQAWGFWQDQVPGDSTVLVGVVDSGVDYLHPDLADVLYINPGEDINGDGLFTEDDINGIDDDENGYIDDLRGWDFSDDNAGDNDIRPPEPGNGAILSHGTHVAGIIGATANNNIGIAGISYRSKIIATKHALDTDISDSYIHNGYDGIMYCAKMGASIINCSWGGLGSSLYEKITIEDIVKNYGVIIVCAAGNGGDDGVGDNNDLAHHYPSDFDSTYAVAATNISDKKTGFSNYGEVIYLSAPGSSIYSTIHVAAGSYASWDGTSMASPVVAGSFALLKAWFPGKSKTWLANALSKSADNIDDKNTAYAGLLGAGRANVYNAIAQQLLPQLAIDFSSFEVYRHTEKNYISPGDTVLLSVLITNKENWLDANDALGKISTASPYLQLIDSLTLFGAIPNGDQQFNDTDQLLFKISEDAPYQDLDILLEVSANDSSAYPYFGAFPLTLTISNNQPGFPLAEQLISAPLALTRFGQKQSFIVAITDAKFVTVFQSDGSIAPGFPVEVGSTNAAPIVADMDGDGQKEIVVVNLSGQVKVLDRWGQMKFLYETGESLYGDADAAVANMDASPDLEIVFGTVRKNMHVIKIDSTELAGFPKSTSHIVNKGVALADLTADGLPEIVFSTFDSKINVWTAAGDTIPGFPQTLTSKVAKAPVVSGVADQKAIILTTLDNRVLVFSAAGSLRSETTLANSILTIPALADLNGDQQPEIYLATADQQLHGLTLDGDSLENFPVYMESNSAAEPVLADFDNDGIFELVLGTENGQVLLIKADGSSFDHFPAQLPEAMRSAPAIADLDADGDLEIVVAGLNNLYALETYGQKNSALAWPTYMGNNQRTGFYTGLYSGIKRDNRAGSDFDFDLVQNYPNPFNPATRIQFKLARAARIDLSVYNALGRKIKTLVNGYQNAGLHSVTFDAGGLASGIYFYRISARQFSKVRKMVLIK